MLAKYLALFALALPACFYYESATSAPQETVEWTIHGKNIAAVLPATIDRLTGGIAASSAPPTDSFSLVWPEAQLEARGRPPLPVRIELHLSVGHTMSVGAHTPYPGLITKIDDAKGRFVNLATNQTYTLRMSESGTWAGRFIHSDSHGSDHLAVELPFALYDDKTSLLVAQSKLLGRFDLNNRSQAHIPVVSVSPTEFQDLRLQTADLGSAIEGRASEATIAAPAERESYRARVSESRIAGISGRSQFADLFVLDSLALYGCGSDELMRLELRSEGFDRSDGSRTPSFTLGLNYAPDLVDPSHKIAYLYPVAGQLEIHSQAGSKVLDIGPGNHGLVASKAFRNDGSLWFDLGVTLRDNLEQPTVARLRIECSATEAACQEMKLETAVDPDGRVVSKRSLSSIIEDSSGIGPVNRRIRRPGGAEPLGGSPGCPGLCPNCLTEGCSVGSGACWTAGAPIGCTAGCTHYANTVQCCRGGFSRMCCVNKCATPP